MCKYCTNVFTVQHPTLFISFFSCRLDFAFLPAHPRNLTSLCLLLGDSVLQGGGSHKARQTANTLSLLVGVQQGPAVSPRLLQLALKGKSNF